MHSKRTTKPGSFGRFLTRRRRILGLNLTDAAIEMETSPEHLGMVEKRENRKFDLDRLPSVAHALDVSLMLLFRLDLRERAPKLERNLFGRTALENDRFTKAMERSFVEKINTLELSDRTAVYELVDQLFEQHLRREESLTTTA